MDSSAPEIEDYTNRWIFHPVSSRLARFLSHTLGDGMVVPGGDGS